MMHISISSSEGTAHRNMIRLLDWKQQLLNDVICQRDGNEWTELVGLLFLSCWPVIYQTSAFIAVFRIFSLWASLVVLVLYSTHFHFERDIRSLPRERSWCSFPSAKVKWTLIKSSVIVTRLYQIAALPVIPQRLLRDFGSRFPHRCFSDTAASSSFLNSSWDSRGCIIAVRSLNSSFIKAAQAVKLNYIPFPAAHWLIFWSLEDSDSRKLWCRLH